MNEYLKTLSKEQLIKIVKGYASIWEPLGCDADIMFREEETDEGFELAAGFYCSHSGENLLDFKD